MGVLVRSPFGLGLKGIRESESRMRALGYNVWLHKYLAFVISGFFAAFAGVLWAYYNGFVGPADVQLVTSVETLLMVPRSRCSTDRKSTRLNSSHVRISYAVFCLQKKNTP